MLYLYKKPGRQLLRFVAFLVLWPLVVAPLNSQTHPNCFDVDVISPAEHQDCECQSGTCPPQIYVMAQTVCSGATSGAAACSDTTQIIGSFGTCERDILVGHIIACLALGAACIITCGGCILAPSWLTCGSCVGCIAGAGLAGCIDVCTFVNCIPGTLIPVLGPVAVLSGSCP